MRSHNIAADIRKPDEWLIILPAAIKFGEEYHRFWAVK